MYVFLFIFAWMRVLKYIIPIVFILILIVCAGIKALKRPQAVTFEKVAEAVSVPDTLRLVFAGDVMVHSTQYHAARREGGDSTYNFNPPFAFIKDFISSADLSLANLEVTLGGEPYSGYPLFSSPPEIIDALKETGFDVLFMANNHTADRGRKGIEATIGRIREAGLFHTGTFRDSTDRADHHPLIVEKKNIRLAFLNYTYGTNGMPVRKPNSVNTTDTVQIREDLEKARRLRPDYIITCMHWGYEYQEKAHAEQRELARFLAENGTDMIIGSHPHVVQPYDEIINHAGDTIPVIYSLGNFISNQQWRRSDGGILFEAVLVKDRERTRRVSSAYEPFWVNRFNYPAHTKYRLVPVNGYLNDSTGYDLDEEQLRKMYLFHEDTKAILPNLEFTGFY